MNALIFRALTRPLRNRCGCRSIGVERSLDAFGDRERQTLFGIVQGSNYPRPCAKPLPKLLQRKGFGGIALGGLAVGEGHDQMCRTIDMTVPHLPIRLSRVMSWVSASQSIWSKPWPVALIC